MPFLVDTKSLLYIPFFAHPRSHDLKLISWIFFHYHLWQTGKNNFFSETEEHWNSKIGPKTKEDWGRSFKVVSWIFTDHSAGHLQ